MNERDHILSHPDYLLSTLAADQSRFAVVNEQTYRQSAFLDHRMQPLPQQAVRMATAALLQAPSSPASRPAELIIAHSSFCASTLLARMLDAEDVLVLREPQVLGQLANMRRAESCQQSVLHAGIRQLCKRYRPQQKLVIKLSNYANNLLPHFMQISSQTRLLIMLGGLEELLVSMRLHADEAADSLPKFLQAMLIDQAHNPALPTPLSELDLFQQTALMWHLQLQQFNLVIAQHGEMTKILLTEQFMADPAQTMTALDQWVGADRDHAQRDSAIAALLNVDAKSRGGGATASRAGRRQAMRASLRNEISATRQWAIEHGLNTEPADLHQARYLLA